MPTIVSSKGQSNIEAIKRYFCSEYACQMVAQAAGVDYERMIAGDYKLLIEPIAYFTHMALSNQRGDFYISDAVKIIIAVVLGALLLAALTLIFNDTVIPRITSEIEGLFG